MSDNEEKGDNSLLERSSKMVEETGVWSVLAKQDKWNSQELQKLLDSELKKRESLLDKKEIVEKEVKRLSVDRKRNIKADLDKYHGAFTRVRSQLNKMIKEKLPGRLDSPEFYSNVEAADELDKASAYLTVLNCLKTTSEQIEVNMETELESEAIELFHRLKRIEVAYLDITDCTHLKQYGKGVVLYWESMLREKFIKDFEELLEAFGWPMKLKMATPTLETQQKFRRAILNVSKLSSEVVKDDSKDESFNSQFMEDLHDPILPVKILMGPLKRRFRFHFFSDKPTSETSRPEWYFSQVKTWLHDLVPFVQNHLEPVSVSEINVSSVVEFVRCVSEMLIIKIDSHLQGDAGDAIFVKILEEAILFENEIQDFITDDAGVTQTFMPPFVNKIFSRPHVLERWLAVEKKACLEKLDDMFASTSAWSRPVVPGPPEIVDLFVAAIRCVTDRFAHLQQPGHRMQFFQLLIELLDDFHVRCLQMWKSKTEYNEYLDKDILIDYVIADALEAVQITLQEWQYLPFFSSLSFFFDTVQQGEEKAMTEIHPDLLNMYSDLNDSRMTLDLDISTTPQIGIFSDTCSLYFCLGEEILEKWCEKIIRRVRDEMRSYAKQKWQSVYSQVEPENVSDELFIPLQTLKDVGKAVYSSMDVRLGEKWMKKLAICMDEMLMATVILPNRFSRAGIVKLNFDLTNGVFPLFVDQNLTEHMFFTSVCSALTVLNISTGEALLLYDTLMNGNFEAHEMALAELNISICQSEAIKILRSRSDLHGQS